MSHRLNASYLLFDFYDPSLILPNSSHCLGEVITTVLENPKSQKSLPKLGLIGDFLFWGMPKGKYFEAKQTLKTKDTANLQCNNF